MPRRIIPVGSFAESQARSPPNTSSIKTILLQLLNYGEEREWEVDGITPALFVELRDYLYENGWENMLVDYRPNKLFVRTQTMGDGIMSSLLGLQARSDKFHRLYGSSTILAGGSADIHYEDGGYKSPDMSLYEVNMGEGARQIAAPTVVFEAASTRYSRNLAMEAARHICLTAGLIQLVVTINIVLQPNTYPTKLQSVTWSHWEEDVSAFCLVSKEDSQEINVIREERRHEEGDSLQVFPPATAFSTVGYLPSMDQKYRIRVTETAKWELFPDPKISEIDIMHRHLYRKPNEADSDTPAFRFSVSDIMKVILKHQEHQELFETVLTPEDLREAVEITKASVAQRKKWAGLQT